MNKEELIRENERLRYELKERNTITSIKSISRWMGLCFIAFMTYLSIKEISGLTTLFSAKIDTNIDIGGKSFNEVHYLIMFIFIVFGILGLSYGYIQKKAREKNTKVFHPYLVKMEQKHPSRTSSNLTELGKTRPEDEV